MIKFVHCFNYAKGVSIADGESWYLKEFVPRVKKLPGVKRYISYPALPTPDNLKFLDTNRFVRRSDLWFEDYAAWQQAYKASPALWTPSKEGMPGFREINTFFIDVEPQYDLLRDTPPEHYKYIAMPIIWRGGVAPQVPDHEDYVIYSYWLRYPRTDVSVQDAEDYYIGHHTREGKQMPGMQHYKTWKCIRVTPPADCPLDLNRWFRITELGQSFETFYRTMLDPKIGVQFTGSPRGPVYGSSPEVPESYHKLFHKPEGEDLLG